MWSVIITYNLSDNALHRLWFCTQSARGLRVLQLICLCVASIKDTALESAVKRNPEIQMTMAKSTNGLDNDRGRVSVALRSTAEMARRKLLPWLTVRKWERNDSFCPVGLRLHLPRVQRAERGGKKCSCFPGLTLE